ncbi:MAG: undecaprenyl-diphosphate phosphatase [Lachnospiraceae bacterium]|nr:undecaprenyl-diphosphate phosphatase [Lachnospiraceae bacterium]
MSLFEAILQGIIQGLAEFLPISSSGHLAIFQEVFDINSIGMVFDVMLHFGTLLAICVAFWSDVVNLFKEGIAIVRDFIINIFVFFRNIGKSDNKKQSYKKMVTSPYRKFVMLVIVSTIPTGILGILLEELITKASTSLLIVGICLLITGVLLLISDCLPSGKKNAKNISYKEAGFVGIVQGFATLPGISRSGSTITACLLCGFDKSFAVKYSFIMSIPAVLGATILELKDFGSLSISGTEISHYIIGTVIAAVIGYICIKTMLVLVRGKKYKYFSYYCFMMGIFAILWHFA